MQRFKDIIVVGLGIAVVLVAAEIGIRLTESDLPDPSVWPSYETHVKGEQLLGIQAATDVLFVGSSITEAAVDPVALQAIRPDITAYNAALPFSKPSSNEYWLETVALPGVRPDAVVYGVAPWPMRNGSGPDPFLEGLRTAVRHRSLLERMSDRSLLLGNVGLLANWDQRLHDTRLRNLGLITQGGHQTLYYPRVGPEVGGKRGEFGDPSMSDDEAAAMRRTIRMLQSQEVTVVLLIEPGRFSPEIDRLRVDEYVAWLVAMAEDLNIEVWDTYSRGWPSEMYADGVHFNEEGTAAFTQHVAALLHDLRPGDRLVRPERPGLVSTQASVSR